MLVYAKAIVGALVTGLGSLAVALNANGTGIGDVTASQWVTIAIATLVSLGGVAATKNKPVAPTK